jgi:hypothetical protein
VPSGENITTKRVGKAVPAARAWRSASDSSQGKVTAAPKAPRRMARREKRDGGDGDGDEDGDEDEDEDG